MNTKFPFYREVSPELTLQRVRPFLASMGITRTADITGLDSLGIPVYTTVRPRAWMVQVSSGKGHTHSASECSSVMEAIEHFHAESPPDSLLFPASESFLSRHSSIPLVSPALLLQSQTLSPFYQPTLNSTWLQAIDLFSQQPSWLPADSVYFMNHGYIATNSNGLSSGNSMEEATLHSLYELLERDAFASLVRNKRVNFRELATRINPSSIPFEFISRALNSIQSKGCFFHILLLPSKINVFTFWVGIGQFDALPIPNSFRFGLGCHSDPSVALMRAITEAAQSRAVFIHGSREDVLSKMANAPGQKAMTPQRLHRHLSSIMPTAWEHAVGPSIGPRGSIPDELDSITLQLKMANLLPLYKVDLTLPEYSIPVVKIIAPALKFNPRIL